MSSKPKAGKAKKAAAPKKFYRHDYAATIRDVNKTFALTIETYRGNKSDQSISTGMLSSDLLMGNNGFVPGWHTILGPEQAAKTTNMSVFMHEAVAADIPMIQLWDYEKSFAPDYVCKFWNSKIPRDAWGIQDAKGKWIKDPVVTAYDENTAEVFFDVMHKSLKALPRKTKIHDKWYLVYEKTNKNRALVGKYADPTLLKAMGKFCVEQEDGRPQAVIFLDSYPAMLPEGMDEDKAGNQMAQQAAMFSKQIKRVKGLVNNRRVIVIGINQLRLNPGARFGSPEYEPCGEALKLFSDTRLMNRGVAIPGIYQNWGDKGDEGHVTERSRSLHDDKDGIDTYRWVTVTVKKNKTGGAPKGSRLHQRIWVSDNQGEARGLDPVFDVWQYLKVTGQLSGNLKKFTFKLKGALKDNPLNKKTMGFLELKTFIVGDAKLRKKLGTKLKMAKDPAIRKACFKQLHSGEGYDRYRGKTEATIAAPKEDKAIKAKKPSKKIKVKTNAVVKAKKK